MKASKAAAPVNTAWTAVTTQKPDRYHWVLAYDARLGQVESLKLTADGRWINNHHDEFDGVTHWMLEPPEPPVAETTAILADLPEKDCEDENFRRPFMSVLRFLSSKHQITDLRDWLDALILRDFNGGRLKK